MSGDARKQRAERAQSLKALIKEKGKVTLKFDKLFESYRERADVVCCGGIVFSGIGVTVNCYERKVISICCDVDPLLNKFILHLQRISRDMFEEALKDLQDDGEIIRTGAHVRLCT